MSSWFKRGKVYYLRFLNENNEWKNKSLGKGVATDLEADAIVARQNLIEINRKTNDGEEKKIVPSNIVDEIKNYCESDLIKNSFDGMKLASRSILKYREWLASFAVFLKENKYLNFNQVGIREVDKYIAKISEAYSNASAVQMRTTLSKFFKWALLKNFIKKNPMDDAIKIKLKKNKTLPFYYTIEQVETILKYCNSFYRNVFGFLYLTGLRVGELCNAEFSFVRQVENTQARKYRYILQLPENTDGFKTKRGRIIWLTEDAMKIIDVRKKESAASNFPVAQKYIFWNRNGTKLKTGPIENYLMRLLITLEIPAIRPVHAWRHTYASHLVMRGVSLQTVMSLLGHSDISHTMRYATLAPDFIQNAVDKNIYLPSTNPPVNIREFKAKGAA